MSRFTDGGKLVVGIRQVFHQSDTCAKQRANDHAGEHQNQHRVTRPHGRADQINRRDREQSADEGEALNCEHAEREEDA